MPVEMKVGQVQAPLTSGSEVVSVGFQPKAIIMWSTGSSASGSFTRHDGRGFGFTDGTNNYSMTNYSQDIDSTPNCKRKVNFDACIEYANNVSSQTYEQAKVSSIGATDFTLGWTNVDGSQRYSGYAAIGGNDITNVAARRFSATDAETVEVNVGFEADVVFLMSSATTGGSQAQESDAIGGLGWGVNHGASPSEEYSIGWYALDQIGAGPLRTHRHDSAFLIETQDEVGALFVNVELDGVNAFVTPNVDLNVTIDPSGHTSIEFFLLAIRGGLWDSGTGAQKVNTAGTTDYSTLFDPEGVFCLSRGGTSDVSSRTAFGAARSVSEQVSAWSGQNADLNSAANLFKAGSLLTFCHEDETYQAHGAFSSFGTNKFTMNWTQDGTGNPDSLPRTFGYLALRSVTTATDCFPIFRPVVMA